MPSAVDNTADEPTQEPAVTAEMLTAAVRALAANAAWPLTLDEPDEICARVRHGGYLSVCPLGTSDDDILIRAEFTPPAERPIPTDPAGFRAWLAEVLTNLADAILRDGVDA